MDTLYALGLDGRQQAYLAALCVITALAWGRAAVVLWINAAVTLGALWAYDEGRVTHAQAMLYGAAGDVLCGYVLIRFGAVITGLLFMPAAIWTVAAITLGIPGHSAYAFVYILLYIQLAAVWCGDGGDGLDTGGGRGYSGNGRGRIASGGGGSQDAGTLAQADRMAE